MIRFGGVDPSGRGIIGLALGPENLERLKAGEPIVVDGASVGYPGVVVFLVFGETDEAALEKVQTHARDAGASVESLDEALAAMRRQKLH